MIKDIFNFYDAGKNQKNLVNYLPLIVYHTPPPLDNTWNPMLLPERKINIPNNHLHSTAEEIQNFNNN